ncbi:MAG: MFS transporter [Chitinophagia bacterium]|nr:MFS transporter [Chitinophagia bacterium]
MKKVFHIYKSSYTGLSASTWWLALVMLINRAGTMVVPFLTLYLTTARHATLSQAGVVMACFGIGAVTGALIGGKITDLLGFYIVQITSLLGGGIMFFVVGMATDYYVICGSVFLLAVINEAFRPANSAAIAQYSKPENRTRSYSLNRLSVNLGWAMGGAFGGLIAQYNYQWLFWIDGSTNIAASILLMGVLSPMRNTHTPASNKVKALPKQVASPYSDKIYVYFLVLTLIFSSVFFQFFTTVPVYFKTVLHLSPAFIGIVMAMNGIIIAFFEMPLVHFMEKRYPPFIAIVIGILFISLTFGMYLWQPGEGSVAVVSFILLTIGEMLSMPFMNTFMMSRTVPENRGQYAGLYSVAWSCAQIFGPFSGTRLADYAGFKPLWWCIIAATLINAIGFAWIGVLSKKADVLQSATLPETEAIAS